MKTWVIFFKEKHKQANIISEVAADREIKKPHTLAFCFTWLIRSPVWHNEVSKMVASQTREVKAPSIAGLLWWIFISEIHFFFQLDDMTCYLGLPDERTFNFKPQMQMQYEYFDWGTHFINSWLVIGERRNIFHFWNWWDGGYHR